MSSRYNPYSLSRMVPRMVHRLHGRGHLDLARGSHHTPGARGNRTSRVRAAGRLRDLFSSIHLDESDIIEAPREEIELRDENNVTQDYDDTPETVRMRQELRAYNRVIAGSEVVLPNLSEPWLTRTRSDGQVVRVPVDRYHQASHRVFSRSRWDMNGRFYGPWWQSIGSDQRANIRINGQPTVEVDFKSLHPALLAAREGRDLPGDLYTLPPGTIAGVEPTAQRLLVKQLVLMSLNARTLAQAYASFRNKQPPGAPAKRLRDAQLQ